MSAAEEEETRLEQVLTTEYTRRDLGVRQVYASNVQPKQTSELLKLLQQPSYQFQELSHLKRVRKQGDGTLVMLLFPKGHRKESHLYWCFFGGGAQAETTTSETNTSPLWRFELKPLVVDVPREQPSTREQFDEWTTLWPFSIPRLPQFVEGDVRCFKDGDIKKMQEYMKLAIEQAKKGKEAGFRFNIGAVIVDPKKGDVVASGYDRRCCLRKSAAAVDETIRPHPLHHAAMICIHEVAKKEVERNKLSIRDPNYIAGNSHQEEDGYLCTGYDLYITREPCTMCSMAILHSRFGRVFYGLPNDALGGLGSRLHLHMDLRLNHRFKVYRGLLARECKSLLQDVDGVV